jgi:hypothetical protein
VDIAVLAQVLSPLATFVVAAGILYQGESPFYTLGRIDSFRYAPGGRGRRCGRCRLEDPENPYGSGPGRCGAWEQPHAKAGRGPTGLRLFRWAILAFPGS